MDEHLELMAKAVRDLQRSGEASTAVAVVDALHPSDLAAVLTMLAGIERADLIRRMQPATAAPAVWELDSERRAETLTAMEEHTIARLIGALPDDGAADLLLAVPPDRRASLLRDALAERAAVLAPLLSHEETTAGGLMSTSFVSVRHGTPVRDVLAVLRQHRDTDFVYYVYVLDELDAPVAVTSLRELVVADPASPVDAHARGELLTVTPDTDQEDVARLASRYDLLAVPVVSRDGRMLGVVTADDVLEVLSSESEEDVERFVGGVEPEGERGVLAVAAARFPVVLGTFIAEWALAWLFLRPLPAARTAVLLAFLPLLLFSGGNAAIAAAGVAIRRIARGERRTVRLLGRELQGAVLHGLIAAAITGGALLLGGTDPRLSAVVTGSVAFTVLLSSAVGTVAPVALWMLGRDPARASGPVLGAAADAAALGVYLAAAHVLL